MSWTEHRARVAGLARSRDADDPELVTARKELAAARQHLAVERLCDHIREAGGLTSGTVKPFSDTRRYREDVYTSGRHSDVGYRITDRHTGLSETETGPSLSRCRELAQHRLRARQQVAQ